MAEATIDAYARSTPAGRAEPTLRPPAAAARGDAARAGTEQDEALRFSFTGSGSEYFRIWVVNLLLTILTLGVYSAWAKVRRLQYFYRNTRLDSSIFDYHGNPKAILKGRILALVLLAAYKISFDVAKPVALLVVLVLAAVMPWLLARAFRFKMANSSYRGLRFHFRGTVAQAYRMLILFPIVLAIIGVFVWSLVTSFSRNPGLGTLLVVGLLPLLALGATVPLTHYLLKRYQHDNTDFGQAPFFFHARPTDFFKIYGKAVGFFFLGSVPAAVFAFLTMDLYKILLDTIFGWLFQLLYGLMSAYAFYLFVRTYLESRIQNLVWNHTELGEHRFESKVSARKLLWIHASNLMLITLTFGLYKPFAVVRLARYRIESMALVPSGSLEDFLSDQTVDNAGAIGQEAGDLFDIDIAL
ncbi:YjgN family protein [Noviherbaspirillum autotrophicum]|uniref:YjgN family protein n=1 Tax=Noviherbaspirillum autotrophicum TaxID=709839 RepID=UPI000694D12D|nr:YjgN family protein [Noviherbaspirillum autotrophicum]